MQAMARTEAEYDRGFLAGLGAAAGVDGRVMDLVEFKLVDYRETARKAERAAARWQGRAAWAMGAAMLLTLPWVWMSASWVLGKVAR